MHPSVITASPYAAGRRASARRLAREGFPASGALTRAFEAAEEQVPEVGTVEVVAYAPGSSQGVDVPEALLPEFVAALIADETVNGFTVGSTNR